MAAPRPRPLALAQPSLGRLRPPARLEHPLHRRRPLRHRPHDDLLGHRSDAAAERPRPVLLRAAPGHLHGRRARRDGARRGHRLPAPAGVGAVLLRRDHRAAARRHRPGAGPQRRPGVVRHRTVPAATVGAGQGHAHPRAGLLRGQRSGRGPPLPRLRPRPRAHGRAPADRHRPARPRDGVGLRRHHHGRAPRGQGQPPPHRPRDRAGPLLGRPRRRHRHAAELPVRRA